MNLQNPEDRELVHNRNISCMGYIRKDGDFDIEAVLTDSKTYDFPSDTHGIVKKNTPYHHMKVRITVDVNLIVKDAHAITISGPYQICPKGAEYFKNLIGIKIGPGWKRRVQERIGGPSGCTHITELTGPLATTAYQTIGGEISRQRRRGMKSNKVPEINQENNLKNSCIAYSKANNK